MRFSYLLVFICFFQATFVFGQPGEKLNGIDESFIIKSSDLNLFNQQLQRVVAKVSPACVQITTREPLCGNPNGVSASGVCVSVDGIIMTAGHMTMPNAKYEIIFDDGRRAPAVGLGKIGKLDAGLLKITESGVYPFAEMGYSSVLKEGEPCFSLAYPSSFSNKKVVRLGFIEKMFTNLEGDVRTNIIVNSCIMEPGDSGGPLFDMDGRVIGTRSYIGLNLNENYDVPVDVFRIFWSALNKPQSYLTLPDADFNSVKNPVAVKNIFSKTELEKQISDYQKKLSRYCVKITGDNKTISGALINVQGFQVKKVSSERASYIISKNSEIGKHPQVWLNNKKYPAKIIYCDDSLDLALLKIDVKTNKGLLLKDIDYGERNNYLQGTLLITAKPNGEGLFSILGTSPFDIPGFYYTAFLGMKLELKNDSNTVVSIQPNSPAAKSGLGLGDIINSIDSKQIKTPEGFIKQIQSKRPGDTIRVVRIKSNFGDTLTIILQQRPLQEKKHIAEQFTDGRSERRDGLKGVFIHSLALKPSDCGSPVFDLDKKLIGINIARYSRVGSLAVSGSNILQFLKSAF
ncbi:MAG TPA: trypsin-like peptidase domain-containing protein [Niabella sp.]|nr:trypsin-like peptidase domain-containing protein [Niabella sp.]